MYFLLFCFLGALSKSLIFFYFFWLHHFSVPFSKKVIQKALAFPFPGGRRAMARVGRQGLSLAASPGSLSACPEVVSCAAMSSCPHAHWRFTGVSIRGPSGAHPGPIQRLWVRDWYASPPTPCIQAPGSGLPGISPRSFPLAGPQQPAIALCAP